VNRHKVRVPVTGIKWHAPLPVDRNVTRTSNLSRSIHRCGTLQVEEGCSRSSKVRQEGGRINRPGSIRKDQAPSLVNIFLDPLGIYLCRTNDAVISHK